MAEIPTVFNIEKSANTDQAARNCALVSDKVFRQFAVASESKGVFAKLNSRVVPLGQLSEVKDDAIRLSNQWRSLLQVTMIQKYALEPYRPAPSDYFDELTLEIELFSATTTYPASQIDTDELFQQVRPQFLHKVFYPGWGNVFKFNGVYFNAKPKGLEKEFAIVDEMTNLRFAASSKSQFGVSGSHVEEMKLQNTGLLQFMRATQQQIVDGKAVEAEDLKLDVESVGIGGCNRQFADIFRRAFAPRLLPAQFIKKFGIQMVRGMVLYGPPGTGKTLIARKIGELLKAREPKLVSGPEILNAYVGKSEENIRLLFKDAEDDYEKKGDEADLHIIIMDELDAICKQRGSRGDSTGTHDSIVNQLLAKMDGVNTLNNVLVIGMTNRLDMIDEALLRPGRFEVQIEIHLPDRSGRLQIFRIHTKTYKENNVLAADIDLEELADLTPNYSGAEIAGVVKAAVSYGNQRMINAEAALSGQAQQKLGEFILRRSDFLRALKEVKPGFGKCDEKVLDTVQQMGFFSACGTDTVLDDIENYIQMLRGSTLSLGTILLHSNTPGTGKSAVAAEIAKRSGIEFVKFISAEQLVLRAATEMERCNVIVKAFADAYKVPEALIILDSVEDIIMYTSEGMRFSNQILTTLLPLLKRGQGKVIVLATTSKYFGMQSLDVTNCFYKQIKIGGLNKAVVNAVCAEWAAKRGVELSGDVNALACVQERETISVRALLQSLEQAAAGKQKVSAHDVGKFFENTW